MAGKVDSFSNYAEVVKQAAQDVADEQAQRDNFVAAASPQQAETYQGTDYAQPDMQLQTPHQRFAEAAQQWQDPATAAPVAQAVTPSEAKLGEAGQVQPTPEMSTQGANLTAATEAPEAFNIMQGSMAGTGLQANMPTPLAPAVAPAALEQPNAVENVAADQAQQQAVQEQIAQRQAQQETLRAQLQHQANIEQAANNKTVEQDAKAKDTDWSSIAGQGIAVALGEYGRYLTGGKENLAVAAIDRAAKAKAEKDKLSSEETIAARKAALDAATIKLKEEDTKTDSQLKRAQIAKIGAEIQTAKDKLDAQQKVANLVKSGSGLSPEDLQILPPKDMARAVLLPSGNYGLAVSPARAKAASDVADASAQAKDSIKKLIDFADYFGNNPLKKTFDLPAIAEAQNLQKQLKGSMRTILVGPGNVSTYEHKLMESVIRDPTVIFAASSATKAALQSLMHKTQAAEKRAYRSAGISIPPSQNDINISKIRAARPNMTEKDAEDLLIQTGKWVQE